MISFSYLITGKKMMPRQFLRNWGVMLILRIISYLIIQDLARPAVDRMILLST